MSTGGRDIKKPKVDNLAALGAARLSVSVTSMFFDTQVTAYYLPGTLLAQADLRSVALEFK